MPCYDATCEEPNYRNEYDQASYELKKMTEKVHLLARLLCEANGLVEELYAYTNGEEDIPSRSKELTDWWREHQEMDRLRLEREKAEQKRKDELDRKRAVALSKLTKADKLVLGIRG